MGKDTHWTFPPISFTSDLAGAHCCRVILGILGEEHHQLCPALESIKNPCGGGSRRAGEGTRDDSEVEGEIESGLDS